MLIGALILGSRFVAEGPSAFLINTDYFLGIERQAPEFEAGLTIVNRQDCIFCPGIGVEIIIRLIVTESKADTPGVEKE